MSTQTNINTTLVPSTGKKEEAFNRVYDWFERRGFDKALYPASWSYQEKLDLAILNDHRGGGGRGSWKNKITDDENAYICGLHAFIRREYDGTEYKLTESHIRAIKKKFDVDWKEEHKKEIPHIELDGY